MAAPITMVASSFNNLLRAQCRFLRTKRHHLLTNGMPKMFLTKRFISTLSLCESMKLCTVGVANKDMSSALGLTSLATSDSVHNLHDKGLGLGLCQVVSNATVTRDYCTSTHAVTDTELKKYMESLADSFTETRELLDDARNSFGSVYFNEDLQEAEESLNETLGRYNALLEKISDSQKEQVLRSIGLKMEELKAQRQVIQDIIRED